MYILIILFIILIIIFYYNQHKLIENFNSIENKYIILIGDSILDNKFYADPSIENYLEEKINTNNILCYAEDNSIIKNSFSQINKINNNLNNSNTYIFVSFGGNDILNKIVYIDNPRETILNEIMNEYNDFIYSLSKKMNQTHIILLNIYYPTNSFFHKYYKYIKLWNQFIKEISIKYKFQIIDLTQFMNQSEDFSYNIEPSVIGGEKISNHILSSI